MANDLISRADAIDAVNSYLALSAVSRTIQNMTSIQEILEKLPSADVVHREVVSQIQWERDTAISQLKDLGYGLGEKIRTDGDTISRTAAIDEAEEWIERYYCRRGGQRERDAIKNVISGMKKCSILR